MQHRKFHINKITLALAIAFSASSVQAVGTGEIVNGRGSIKKQANTTVVNQRSKRMIVNWDNMDIGKNEAMRFNQPGKNAAVLNRINSIDPTLIQGALRANGQVFIVNPNGVLISNGATINVGSLVASSLDIKNTDFARGKLAFNGTGSGKVTNAGNINAEERVALIGNNQVSNTGNIRVQGRGGAVLASGETITLSFPACNSMKVKIDQGSLTALVENGGMIVTAKGDIALTAWATDTLTRSVINNSGTLDAASVYRGDLPGSVYLSSEGNGGVDVAGNLRGLAVKVKGDAINVKDNALLTSFSDPIRLMNNQENGYVKLGKSRLQGDLEITANNVFAGGADDKPTFVGQGNNVATIISSAQSTEIGNSSVSDPSQIVSGKGIINKDAAEALGKQAELRIAATAGDLNLNNVDLGNGQMLLVSDKGNVNVNGNVKAGSLNIRSQAFAQAKDAGITMAREFSVNAQENITQGGNITAGEDIIVASSAGNVTQAVGSKTAAKRVSYRGKTLELNGETKAKTLSLATNKYTQSADSSLIAEDALKLQGGDFDLTAGKADVRSISLEANSLNLSTDKNTVINRDSHLSGDLNIDSTADVSLSVLTVMGAAKINANNIVSNPSHSHYDPDQLYAAKGVTLNAKNDINIGLISTNENDPLGAMKLNAGKDITVQRQLIAADIDIKAKGKVRLDNRVFSNNDIAIAAGDDLELNGDVRANGNTTLAGKNIRTSAYGSIASKKNTSLRAKDALTVNSVSAGTEDNYYGKGTKSNVVLVGDNVIVKQVYATGNVDATTERNFFAARDITGNNINISAGGDIDLRDRVSANGAITLVGDNIKTSAYAPVSSKKNMMLSAKNTIALGYISAGTEDSYYGKGTKGDVLLDGANVYVNKVSATGDVQAAASKNFASMQYITGNDISIFAGNDLELRDRVVANGNIDLTGNNVKTSIYSAISSNKDTTIVAKNTIAVGDISAGTNGTYRTKGTKGDVVLKGDNVYVNRVDATGNVNATAGKSFSGMKDIAGNDINISAGDDVSLRASRLNALGNVAVTGNNIQTSTRSSISGKGDVTLTAKNTIAVDKVAAARNLTLAAKEGIYANEVRGDASVKATSTAGSITFNVLDRTKNKELNAAKGVFVRRDLN